MAGPPISTNASCARLRMPRLGSLEGVDEIGYRRSPISARAFDAAQRTRLSSSRRHAMTGPMALGSPSRLSTPMASDLARLDPPSTASSRAPATGLPMWSSASAASHLTASSSSSSRAMSGTMASWLRVLPSASAAAPPGLGIVPLQGGNELVYAPAPVELQGIRVIHARRSLSNPRLIYLAMASFLNSEGIFSMA